MSLMRKFRSSGMLVASLLLVACPTPASDEEASAEAGVDSSGGTTTSESNPDAGTPADLPMSCDPYVQDCPEGFKCNPYSFLANLDFVGYGCFEVAPDASGLYADCNYLGAPYSGADTCRVGETCWGIDENDVGFCIGLCQLVDGGFGCADPDAVCWDHGGVAPCRPKCNPLGEAAEECPRDWLGCAPFGPYPESFACHFHTGATLGDECSSAWACEYGMACAFADALPECKGERCCTLLCDTTAVEPCDLAEDCVAWFSANDAPAGLEHLGVCLVP